MLSQQTWPSCLSLHTDPLFSTRECSLSPSGVAGIRGGQKAQATPLLEADPCLCSTSCTSRVQLRKVLTLCVKKKRKKAVRGRKFTPPPQSTESKYSHHAKQSRLLPGRPGVQVEKAPWIQRVRTAAKFPLLVPGKSICLKMLLGEVNAQL